MIALDFEAHDRRVIDDLENHIAALEAKLAEMTRRRDEWRKKAEGYDDVRLALREKVGTPWPPNMSRALWAGIAADEKKRADDAEARLSALEATPPAPKVTEEAMPQDVIDLVIAAREYWDQNDDLSPESRALDKALEEFSSRVPYADEPDTLTAAQESAPKVTATHRHKKRGSEYMLIGIGKMQAEDWEDVANAFDEGGYVGGTRVDMREVAIYRSVDDGSLWVRPREEFEDGRFEALTAAQESGQ